MASTSPLRADRPILHLFCGKIAAGKSTLAAELARQPGTVLICEDEWLYALFGDQMRTMGDYVRMSEKLRAVMGPHVSMLLASGVSVVLDFPANTPGLRQWMRDVCKDGGADHRLHFLNLPDELCKARLRQRNQTGAHAFATSDAQFDQISSYFVPPQAEEGFDIVTYETEII